METKKYMESFKNAIKTAEAIFGQHTGGCAKGEQQAINNLKEMVSKKGLEYFDNDYINKMAGQYIAFDNDFYNTEEGAGYIHAMYYILSKAAVDSIGTNEYEDLKLTGFMKELMSQGKEFTVMPDIDEIAIGACDESPLFMDFSRNRPARIYFIPLEDGGKYIIRDTRKRYPLLVTCNSR